MPQIYTYLDPSLVVYLEASDCPSCITRLVEIAASQGYIKDKERLLAKVLERESIVSTGIGLSVALPHAKLSELDNFFIIVGVLSKGIDWKALDGHPVRLVFLIAGPDNRQNTYLEILSKLTLLLKNEDFRKKLLTSKSPEVMIDFFKEVEDGFKNQ